MCDFLLLTRRYFHNPCQPISVRESKSMHYKAYPIVSIANSSHQLERRTFITMSEDNEEKRIRQPSAGIEGRVPKSNLCGGGLARLRVGLVGLVLKGGG